MVRSRDGACIIQRIINNNKNDKNNCKNQE